MEALRTGVSEAVATMGRKLEALQGSQEALADRAAFGQSDEEAARSPARPFSSIAGQPAESTALFLASERPQLVALVLSFLDDAEGARILSLLPADLRPEVVRRMAGMDFVAPEVGETVEKVLSRKLGAIARARYEAGGLPKVVGILNASPRAVEKQVIEALMAGSPELAETVKKNMFVFEDIAMLDDESVGAVLAAADERDILVAMKPVPEALRERLFARFPEGRRERVKAAFAELGRVRLSEADAAGQRVVALIRKLEEQGLIGIQRQGPD